MVDFFKALAGNLAATLNALTPRITILIEVNNPFSGLL
jgi:hypothetical protein